MRDITMERLRDQQRKIQHKLEIAESYLPNVCMGSYSRGERQAHRLLRQLELVSEKIWERSDAVQ